MQLSRDDALAANNHDIRLLEMARDRGIITSDQLRRLREESTRLTRDGRPRTPTGLAIERGMIDEDGIHNLETDAWIESLPGRLGNYRIMQLLGRGGMAVVFQAQDVSLGKTVALKVLLPEFAASEAYLSRFRREARIAAKLSHPNTVQVFGADEHGGVDYLVMEYVEGETLSNIIKARGRISEHEALDMLIGLTGALEEAAEMGIVHRDIKPGNVIVSKWDVAKLADFGIAKEFSDIPDPKIQVSLTMGVVGTPNYMSPEQARGARQLDFRSDIYSLGTTLYHMVVGDLPFYADTPQETMFRVASAAPKPPRKAYSGLSEETAAVICKMMAKDPEQRYASHEDLRRDLVAARDGEEVSIDYAEAVDLLLPTRRDVEEEADDGGEAINPLRSLAVAAGVAAIGLLLLLMSRGCG